MTPDGMETTAAGRGAARGPTRRELREAHLRRRSLMIAAASTTAVVALIVILVPMAPGWERVQKSFFNLDIFTKTFPGLLQAFLVDVMIFAWCAPMIAVLGLVIARGLRGRFDRRYRPALLVVAGMAAAMLILRGLS